METNRQIAISAQGFLEVKPDLRDDETKEWSLGSDIVFVLQFNKDGKIENILEMLDSEAAKGFFPVMGRARENLGKLQGKQWAPLHFRYSLILKTNNLTRRSAEAFELHAYSESFEVITCFT